MTTGMSRPLKWLLGIAIALLLLASLGVVARHFATEKLRQAVEQALGPTPKSPASKPRFPRSHSTASASRPTRIGRRSTNWQRGASSFVPTGEPSCRGRFASPASRSRAATSRCFGARMAISRCCHRCSAKREDANWRRRNRCGSKGSAGRVASGDCHQPRAALGCCSRLLRCLDPPAGASTAP